MMTAAEVSIVILLRQLWRELPSTCPLGPQRVPARLVRALRAERGLPAGAPVSVQIPRSHGMLSVALVDDETETMGPAP